MHLRMISTRSAKPIRAEEFGSSNPIVVFRSPYRYQLLSGSPLISVTAQARKAVSDQCSKVLDRRQDEASAPHPQILYLAVSSLWAWSGFTWP